MRNIEVNERAPDTMIGGVSLMRRKAMLRYANSVRLHRLAEARQRSELFLAELAEFKLWQKSPEGLVELKAEQDAIAAERLEGARLENRVLRAWKELAERREAMNAEILKRLNTTK